jgi:phosphoglycolate phosphatase-like HAD superfamily hydrolase
MLPVRRRPTSAEELRPVLVFDFDGVLCDSLEECMMVAWYAHTNAAVSEFVDPGLAGVPHAVVERFERCRPFMRHLLHLLVPLVEADPPATRSEFAARFEAIGSREAEAFARAAERYRAALRRDHPERWCARHGVERRLDVLVRGAYIATARDTASVGHILRAHGMEIHDDHVFGSLRSKPPALDAIATREARRPSEVILVDDSIENCIAARDAGFATHWASWGYHAPEDAETARRWRIPVLTVEALLQQRSTEPAVTS